MNIDNLNYAVAALISATLYEVVVFWLFETFQVTNLYSILEVATITLPASAIIGIALIKKLTKTSIGG